MPDVSKRILYTVLLVLVCFGFHEMLVYDCNIHPARSLYHNRLFKVGLKKANHFNSLKKSE